MEAIQADLQGEGDPSSPHPPAAEPGALGSAWYSGEREKILVSLQPGRSQARNTSPLHSNQGFLSTLNQGPMRVPALLCIRASCEDVHDGAWCSSHVIAHGS